MECPKVHDKRIVTPNSTTGAIKRTLVRSLASTWNLHPYASQSASGNIQSTPAESNPPGVVVRCFPNLCLHLADIQDDILRLYVRSVSERSEHFHRG